MIAVTVSLNTFHNRKKYLTKCFTVIDRMWGWGKLPVPSIQMFVANQAKQLCLDQNITDAILEKVEMYQDLEDKSKLDPNDHSQDPQGKGKKKGGRNCIVS